MIRNWLHNSKYPTQYATILFLFRESLSISVKTLQFSPWEIYCAIMNATTPVNNAKEHETTRNIKIDDEGATFLLVPSSIH